MDIRVVNIGPKSRLGMAALAAGVIVVGGTLLVLGAALLLALAAAGAVIGTGVVLYNRLTGRSRRAAELHARLRAERSSQWARHGLDPRLEVQMPDATNDARPLPPARDDA